jgi:outer membrane murein-binding lipoprotein Lpp
MIAIVDNVTFDIKTLTKAAEKLERDVQDLRKQVLSFDL